MYLYLFGYKNQIIQYKYTRAGIYYAILSSGHDLYDMQGLPEQTQGQDNMLNYVMKNKSPDFLAFISLFS